MKELLAAYEISPADLDRIRGFGQLVRPRLADAVKAFYMLAKQLR